ncbi:hypothetical protein A3768_1272 [Ralstonia solanacearum]|nr:hypothetical protein F504_2236 [Ralstonia pseudosolanacearum FQY_4]ANH32435.1 hypothetical protein A3768_1272 [Ralstonia solanacearum]
MTWSALQLLCSGHDPFLTIPFARPPGPPGCRRIRCAITSASACWTASSAHGHRVFRATDMTWLAFLLREREVATIAALTALGNATP